VKMILARRFTEFALTGALFMVLATGGNWLTIDILGFNSFWATQIIYSILFVAKYAVYVKIGTVESGLWRYTAVNILLSIACSISIAFLVERVSLSALVSSILVFGASVVLRFFVLLLSGSIRREHGHPTPASQTAP
jgi:hypothetical protein